MNVMSGIQPALETDAEDIMRHPGQRKLRLAPVR